MYVYMNVCMCIHTHTHTHTHCTNYTILRFKQSTFVIFTRAVSELSHNNGCGPLPEKVWTPLF